MRRRDGAPNDASQEGRMKEEPTGDRMNRRVFLKAGGLTAVAIGAGAAIAANPFGGGAIPASAAIPVDSLRFIASDGFAWFQGLDDPDFGNLTTIPSLAGFGDRQGLLGLYIFGFKHETSPTNRTTSPNFISFSSAVRNAFGDIQFSAPFMAFKESHEVRLGLGNSGFLNRPDIPDGHTIHWHGFRQALPLFDGVPEVSVDVPPHHLFTYVYRPEDPGTFIYHCHWDDVEHVQMGMQGIVYITPKQNGTAFTYKGKTFRKFAYNDRDGSTGYDREYSLLLDDLWSVPHINDQHIQDSLWTDYEAQWWTINGRSYPDTVKPGWWPIPGKKPAQYPLPVAGYADPNDPILLLASQPNSSLIQCNGGDTVLLRFSNLGYQQESMQLEGIKMRMVGEDANILRGPEFVGQNGNFVWGANESYMTDTVYVGPGDSRDAIFEAPPYDGTAPLTDANVLPSNPYNRYYLMNRDLNRLNNYGHTTNGLGGQVTEVRVYRDPIPAQDINSSPSYPDPNPASNPNTTPSFYYPNKTYY
jgi:FtsP/CotA-like multicopper oxidase with cupredoxin domain